MKLVAFFLAACVGVFGCYDMPSQSAANKPCWGEPACPTGYTCRFPGVDTHAVCMQGDNRLDIAPALPR